MRTFRTWSDRLAPAGVWTALLLACGLGQHVVRGLGSDATAIVPAPPPMIGLSIDPRIVRRLLGTNLVMADLIWIDTLIKSDASREPQPFTAFYRAFKTIVALDPENLFAYYVAGTYLSVIKDDIKGATAILREGAKYIEAKGYFERRDSWGVCFTLGYHLLFEEREIEEGSYWVRKAAEMKGAPMVVTRLASRVATEAGQLEVAARILTDAHAKVAQPEEKARIEEKMLEVAARQQLLELNEKFEKFLSSTGARALPKKRSFQLFLRSISQTPKDMLGRSIGLGSTGRIEVMDK